VSEVRRYQIKKFLLENPNSQFKGIFDHLKKIDLGYNSNKGLDKMLKSMIPQEIIKNPKAKPYPTYDVVRNNVIDSAIKGEIFRNQLFPIDGRTLKDGIEKCYFYEIENPNHDEYLNYDNNEKFVKYMIMRYGFFLLSVFVKGHEQAITNKSFDKKEWIKNALNIFQDEKYYSEFFLRLLFDKKNVDEPLNKDNKKIKNKIKYIKKSMNKLYPDYYMDIKEYEKHIEDDVDYIKILKEKHFWKNYSPYS
jgi:hypothetical protein